MVNTGKPSGACAVCKQRKIKCDERRPGCVRCEIAGRDCPGYPPKDVVAFRDETAAAEKRVKKKAKSQSPDFATDTKSPDPESFPTLSVYANSVEMLYNRLQRELQSGSVEDAAVAFFFQYYIPVSRYMGAGGVYLSSLYNIYMDTFPSSALHHATSAVALVVLSRFPNKSHLLNLASSKYGHALRLLTQAIGDAEQAKSDATIMCAMIMVFYESLVNPNTDQSVYKKHHEGLSVLLRNKGESIFQSKTSLGIYRSVRTQMSNRCLMGCEAMDDFWLLDNREGLNDPNLFPGAEPGRIATLATRLRQRSMDLLEINSAEESDLEANAILSEASNLDNKTLSSWSWQCQQANDIFVFKLPLRETRSYGAPGVWRGRVDVYDDLKHAMVFNSFRLNRIYLQSVIIRCLARLSATEEQLQAHPRYKQACKTLQSLVDDMCACVPTFLGEEEILASSGGPDEAKENGKIAQKGLGAYCMMFSMYASSNVEIISDEQRQWLRGRLWMLSDYYGVKLASWMAQVQPDMIFRVTYPKHCYFRNGLT